MFSTHEPHITLHRYTSYADDMCWHVPFALWVYDNGWESFQHELHTWIYPFWALMWSAVGLTNFSWIWPFSVHIQPYKNCTPLSMNLMICADMFHLCPMCIWQRIEKLQMWTPCLDISFWGLKGSAGYLISHGFGHLQSTYSHTNTKYFAPLSMNLMMYADMFLLPYECMAMDGQALKMICIPWSIPSMPHIGQQMCCSVMMDLSKSSTHPAVHLCMKLCPWLWWHVLAYSICLVSVW